ncbi:CoA-binding protein [Galbibacter sp. EGI 63066]|uniref:CoA-binding protein n=1 Tax=Galbibacter sp. EGI 63066 TaxID=2993559 RepID=UPI002248FDB6|nr:CoA-binding protein [Galbibacter sp. EGI 63066]MCX2681597.1 CoA-binding protein [Galbibacter sp. EGI 63066]
MGKTLVMGASLDPSRYSYLAVNRLVSAGEDVVAFGKRKGKVAGISIDTELLSYKNIDTVSLYLNSQNQKTFYNYIVGLKPKRVIFNPGAENPEFYNILESHGIHAEVACTLVLLATKQY